MALSERYVNAWHMLIERQYLICRNYLYWSGVQVSKWGYGYLEVRPNKFLIVTICYLILSLITQGSIIFKRLDSSKVNNKCLQKK